MSNLVYINEMFTSVQGEGMHTGTPSFFIRFQGCNVNCTFCDSADTKSQKQDPNKEYSIGEMVMKVHSVLSANNVKRIIFTGGEPFLQQQGMRKILVGLKERNNAYQFGVETSGSVETYLDDWQGTPLEITLSPKKARVYPFYEEYCAELKLLVSATPKTDPVKIDKYIEQFRKRSPAPIYFQPIWNKDIDGVNSNVLERAIALAQKYEGRVSIQTHKYLGLL